MNVPIVTSTSNIPVYAKELIEKINAKSASQGGTIGIINGAFGDMTECDGLIEEVIEKPEGGIYCKMFGNPHLFKGFPRREFVDMIGLPKAFISLVPREIFRSKLIIFFVALLYIFSRKHFWHTARTIFHRIHDLSLLKVRYDSLKKESRPVRALRGAFNDTFRQLYDVDVNSKMVLGEETNYVGKREKYITLACVAELTYSLIEGDNAYRLKLQDIFKEFNRELAEKDVRKEVLRLLDILIQRERQNLMIDKWKFIRKVASFVLRLKEPKKFAKTLLMTIEKNEMIPDEDDWYFSLRRSQYDFGGLPIEERLKIKEQIDREKGHVPMQSVHLTMNGKKGIGIKLVGV